MVREGYRRFSQNRKSALANRLRPREGPSIEYIGYAPDEIAQFATSSPEPFGFPHGKGELSRNFPKTQNCKLRTLHFSASPGACTYPSGASDTDGLRDEIWPKVYAPVRGEITALFQHFQTAEFANSAFSIFSRPRGGPHPSSVSDADGPRSEIKQKLGKLRQFSQVFLNWNLRTLHFPLPRGGPYPSSVPDTDGPRSEI